MRKSSRFELILTIFVAGCFVMNSFYYTDFSYEGEFALPRLLFYLVMIIALFNAGMVTQKFIHSRKEKMNHKQ
ncbi:hypothetical protein [Ureibacillus sinduriensis]|uniref:Uncharacterized protein n=1 Tax=Ureibacillus sinduriensis BLB-1 = JCM 15800 TaxID=1384057 RepID=A0A0A3IQH3_9BACL|nr:hypothetical protein [Ureibacillus sinduriensis]KGR77082.1 hypothetical protein CD33_04030 [Ureibacillus sinduriensis BLB-1 = JCM 15800]